jgi:hypothetical protein
VPITQDFEQAECTDDDNPCTFDRCQAGTCAHPAVPDPQGCLPLVPSYRRATNLRRGLDRVLTFVNEIEIGGDTGGALVEQLEGLMSDLDAAIRALGGSDEGVQPAGGTGSGTTAQVRGRLALVWLKGTPARAKRLMGLAKGGLRRRDLLPEDAKEIRRNGRILLTETKALKRDVRNLQRTFTVFQR